MYFYFCNTAEKTRQVFVCTLSPAHGMTYNVDRENLFDSVVTLYQSKANQLLNEYPLHIRFAKERAINAGGVSRDMFSAFYEEAYETFFDGGARPTLPDCSPHCQLLPASNVGNCHLSWVPHLWGSSSTNSIPLSSTMLAGNDGYHCRR